MEELYIKIPSFVIIITIEELIVITDKIIDKYKLFSTFTLVISFFDTRYIYIRCCNISKYFWFCT